MKFSLKHMFVATALIGAALAVGLFIASIVKTRSVVSIDHPNGTRLRIVQKFTAELFDTSIYFDDGDGQWRWYYYDHEDWYWGSARSRIEGNLIQITSGERSVEIDTKTGDCTISNGESYRREYDKSTRITELPSGISGDNTKSENGQT